MNFMLIYVLVSKTYIIMTDNEVSPRARRRSEEGDQSRITRRLDRCGEICNREMEKNRASYKATRVKGQRNYVSTVTNYDNFMTLSASANDGHHLYELECDIEKQEVKIFTRPHLLESCRCSDCQIDNTMCVLN